MGENYAARWLAKYKTMSEESLINRIARWDFNVDSKKEIREALDQDLIIKEVKDDSVIYRLNEGVTNYEGRMKRAKDFF